ncbi:FAS1 domain-containing protein [Aspergillus spinulosporus]
MRQLSITALVLFLFLYCSIATAWSLPSSAYRKRIPESLLKKPRSRHAQSIEDLDGLKEWLSNQQPLRGAVMVPSSEDNEQTVTVKGGANNGPTISDVLPKTRGINIYASLTRQFETVESRLKDQTQNVTVLAPRNSAIQDLPHKPWENPEDYEKFGEMNAYEGDEGQDRAKRNLERFVSAHVVAQSPWKEGEEAETLGGEKLSWRKDGDRIYIEPRGIRVDNIAEQVTNGEVWVIDGVINYTA